MLTRARRLSHARLRPPSPACTSSRLSLVLRTPSRRDQRSHAHCRARARLIARVRAGARDIDDADAAAARRVYGRAADRAAGNGAARRARRRLSIPATAYCAARRSGDARRGTRRRAARGPRRRSRRRRTRGRWSPRSTALRGRRARVPRAARPMRWFVARRRARPPVDSGPAAIHAADPCARLPRGPHAAHVAPLAVRNADAAARASRQRAARGRRARAGDGIWVSGGGALPARLRSQRRRSTPRRRRAGDVATGSRVSPSDRAGRRPRVSSALRRGPAMRSSCLAHVDDRRRARRATGSSPALAALERGALDASCAHRDDGRAHASGARDAAVVVAAPATRRSA